jgi:hypothetical protein
MKYAQKTNLKKNPGERLTVVEININILLKSTTSDRRHKYNLDCTKSGNYGCLRNTIWIRGANPRIRNIFSVRI